MRRISPREAVATLEEHPRLVDGTDERFTSYGIMGVPFGDGHYLALRDMLASSVGPPYRAIWHRTPDGHWTLFTTTAAELSCPRYFGSAAVHDRVSAIDVDWPDTHTLQVTMGDRLTWRVHLGETAATRMMTAMGAVMPDTAWDSEPVLAGMGPIAGAFLRAGRIRLRGVTPNGPRFRAAPLQIWQVVGGAARLDGADQGPLGPLPTQCHLEDFWMPQRGIFFVGRVSFSPRRVAAHSTDAWSRADH